MSLLTRLRTLAERFPDQQQRNGRPVAQVAWRIGASIWRRRWAAGPVFSVVEIGGARVRADLRTPLGLSLYRYGLSSVEARLLRELLKPGDVFVDGGANVGIFSLLAASLVGTSGRVLACEPGPGTMSLLEANVSENDFSSLESHQVALSDRPGTASFVVFEDGSGLASFAPEAPGGKPVDVEVTTLDHLTAAYGSRVALVKLDIEGSEVRAIRGASRLLARAEPVFLIEVEPDHLERQGDSVEELERILSPHGYEAYALTPESRLYKLSGAWLPPDPASPNLVLASPGRSDRLAALTQPSAQASQPGGGPSSRRSYRRPDPAIGSSSQALEGTD